MNRNVWTSFTILCMLSTVFLIRVSFNVQPARASGTIYIRADGSIEPSTANVTSADSDTYYFTDNNYDSIVVERDNIVIDGAGYTLQGSDLSWVMLGTGISLSGRSNVAIKNMEITACSSGIWVEDSYNVRISENNITINEDDGIHVLSSSNCSIFGNNITNNNDRGIWFWPSSNNRIFGNNLVNNGYGVMMRLSCENNKIYENNIANNIDAGIGLAGSLNNIFYHNNFVNNTLQVQVTQKERKQTNTWDNGTEGNYWGDYTGDDQNGDGIGETPYTIEEANKDNYPLMSPWSPSWSPQAPATPLWMQWWLWAIAVIVIVALAGAVYSIKRRKPPTTPMPPPEKTHQSK